jgi:type III secretion protein J
MRLLILSVVVAAFFTACAGEQEIVSGLTEYEANEILVVLEAKGIEAQKTKAEGRTVTYNVVVGGVDAKDAMRLLVANHLPRVRSNGLPEVYPAGGGGLIPTKSEEKAKFMMALQGEIEKKLKVLPGIVAAQVTIVSPEKDVVRDLDTTPPNSTASVAIVYNAIDERGTAAVKEDEVKNLVAASVEDLKPANVMVVMKKNVPATLVNDYADSGSVEAPVAAVTAYGFKFADKKSAAKAQIFVIVGALVCILSLGVGAGAIVRSMGLRRAKQKAEAELTSMRKAGRATQTGLSQQQAAGG